MQPEEQNQHLPTREPEQSERPEYWQQPAASVAPEASMVQAPDEPTEPVVEPLAYDANSQQTDSTQQNGSENIDDELGPEVAEGPSDIEGEEELARWQAAEHIHRDKSAVWYVFFAAIVLALMAIAIFLIKSWTFAVLVPVMAAALAMYALRPPAVLTYTLSRKGLHINDRLYGFDMFKEFGLIHDDDENAIMLVPRKRFQPGVTVYFPDEVGEAVVDMFAARLPMHEVRLDPIDRLIRRLRI